MLTQELQKYFPRGPETAPNETPNQPKNYLNEFRTINPMQFAATHAIFTMHPGHPAWPTPERLPNGTFYSFF